MTDSERLERLKLNAFAGDIVALRDLVRHATRTDDRALLTLVRDKSHWISTCFRHVYEQAEQASTNIEVRVWVRVSPLRPVSHIERWAATEVSLGETRCGKGVHIGADRLVAARPEGRVCATCARSAGLDRALHPATNEESP